MDILLEKGIKSFALIRGYLQSGDDYISTLLNLHPRLCCDGKTQVQRLFEIAELILKRNDYLYATRLVERGILLDGIRDLSKTLLRSQCISKPGAEILIDQSLGPILEDFIPNAKIFFLIRDPRDVLVSWTYQFVKNDKNLWANNRDPKMLTKRELYLKDPEYFEKFPEQLCDFEPCLAYVASSWNEASDSYFRYLERSGDGKDSKCMLIKYENIFVDVGKVANLMYEFLGVDSAEVNMNEGNEFLLSVNREVVKEEVVSPSNFAVSMGFWKKYLTPEIESFFVEAVRTNMNKFGYCS